MITALRKIGMDWFKYLTTGDSFWSNLWHKWPKMTLTIVKTCRCNSKLLVNREPNQQYFKWDLLIWLLRWKCKFKAHICWAGRGHFGVNDKIVVETACHTVHPLNAPSATAVGPKAPSCQPISTHAWWWVTLKAKGPVAPLQPLSGRLDEVNLWAHTTDTWMSVCIFCGKQRGVFYTSTVKPASVWMLKCQCIRFWFLAVAVWFLKKMKKVYCNVAFWVSKSSSMI